VPRDRLAVRLRVAAAVLRGHPAAYGLRFEDGRISPAAPGSHRLAACSFINCELAFPPARLEIRCSRHALPLVPGPGGLICPMDGQVEVSDG